MASEKHQKALLQLRTDVSSTQSLIVTFQSSLNTPTSSTSIPDPPNPLRLLQDASKLLKAQSTKLSLLIITKPFTPSAISSVLKPISGECLPALMSALELCRPEAYTTFLRDSIEGHMAQILREMKLLLQTMPVDDGDSADREGRNTLANTGVLWEACDALVSLAENGLVGLALAKAESYHALLKDAIAELEEWEPDAEDGEDDPFGSEESSEEETQEEEEVDHPPAVTSAASMLTPPPTPSPLRQSHEKTLAMLRLVRLLYPAIKKRRIQTFPPITRLTTPVELPNSKQVTLFDGMLKCLKYFTEAADEVAEKLYDNSPDFAESVLEMVERMGIAFVKELRLHWGGAEDEFTEWSEKWKDRFQTVMVPVSFG